MERELLRYLPADDTSTSANSRRHARRHRQAEALHGSSSSELPSERHGFSLIGQLPNKQGEFECYAL